MGAFDLPLAQKVALFVALPVASLLLYYLLKKSNEEDDEILQPVVTARHTIIEVKVPRSLTGSIIGHRGARIKEVQDATGAKIQFKDDHELDTERICVIRGTESSAQHAEMIVRRMIAEEPPTVENTITVPQRTVGRIIGRGGETIRHLCRASKAKIQVPQEDKASSEGYRTIRLQGSPEAVALAKNLIEEKVQEEEAFRARSAISASNRQERGPRRKAEATETDNNKNGEATKKEEEKIESAEASKQNEEDEQAITPPVGWPNNRQDYLDVYISAVENPAHFWVQVISSKSARLDKLMEDMTRYYSSLDGAKMTVLDPQVGDLLAAPFQYDQNWYRVRVTEVKDDQVDLYYVDFGDSCYLKKSEVRHLRGDFLCLPFQAIEACLANIKPKGDEWSEEAIELFEDMTYTAKWKVLQAKTINYVQVEDVSMPCLDLVDTNTSQDKNIAKVLIERGFAEFAQDKSEELSSTKNILPQMTDDCSGSNERELHPIKRMKLCAADSFYDRPVFNEETLLQQHSPDKQAVKSKNGTDETTFGPGEREEKTESESLVPVDMCLRGASDSALSFSASLVGEKGKSISKIPRYRLSSQKSDYFPCNPERSVEGSFCDKNNCSMSGAKPVLFDKECDFSDVNFKRFSDVVLSSSSSSVPHDKSTIGLTSAEVCDNVPYGLGGQILELRFLASRPNTLALDPKQMDSIIPQALNNQSQVNSPKPSNIDVNLSSPVNSKNVPQNFKFSGSDQNIPCGYTHDDSLPKNMRENSEKDPGQKCLPAPFSVNAEKLESLETGLVHEGLGCYCVNLPQPSDIRSPFTDCSTANQAGNGEAISSGGFVLAGLPEGDWCEEVEKEASIIVHELKAQSEMEDGNTTDDDASLLPIESELGDYESTQESPPKEKKEKKTSIFQNSDNVGTDIYWDALPEKEGISCYKKKPDLLNLPEIAASVEALNIVKIECHGDFDEDIPYIDSVSDDNATEPEEEAPCDSERKPTTTCHPASFESDTDKETFQPVTNLPMAIKLLTGCKTESDKDDICKSDVSKDLGKDVDDSTDEPEYFSSVFDSDQSSCYSDAVEGYMEIPLAETETDLETELMVEPLFIKSTLCVGPISDSINGRQKCFLESEETTKYSITQQSGPTGVVLETESKADDSSKTISEPDLEQVAEASDSSLDTDAKFAYSELESHLSASCCCDVDSQTGPDIKERDVSSPKDTTLIPELPMENENKCSTPSISVPKNTYSEEILSFVAENRTGEVTVMGGLVSPQLTIDTQSCQICGSPVNNEIDDKYDESGGDKGDTCLSVCGATCQDFKMPVENVPPDPFPERDRDHAITLCEGWGYPTDLPMELKENHMSLAPSSEALDPIQNSKQEPDSCLPAETTIDESALPEQEATRTDSSTSMSTKIEDSPKEISTNIQDSPNEMKLLFVTDEVINEDLSEEDETCSDGSISNSTVMSVSFGSVVTTPTAGEDMPFSLHSSTSSPNLNCGESLHLEAQDMTLETNRRNEGILSNLSQVDKLNLKAGTDNVNNKDDSAVADVESEHEEFSEIQANIIGTLSCNTIQTIVVEHIKAELSQKRTELSISPNGSCSPNMRHLTLSEEDSETHSSSVHVITSQNSEKPDSNPSEKPVAAGVSNIKKIGANINDPRGPDQVDIETALSYIGSETSSGECRDLINACKGEESLEFEIPCLDTSTDGSTFQIEDRCSDIDDLSHIGADTVESGSFNSQSTISHLTAFSPVQSQLLLNHKRFFLEDNQNAELVSSRLKRDDYVDALRNTDWSLTETYFSKPPSYANAAMQSKVSLRLVGHLAPQYSRSYKRNRTQSLNDLPEDIMNDVEVERNALSDGDYHDPQLSESEYGSESLYSDDVDDFSSDGEDGDISQMLPSLLQRQLGDAPLSVQGNDCLSPVVHSSRGGEGHGRCCSLYDEYQEMLQEAYANTSMLSMTSTATTEYNSALEDLDGPALCDSLENVNHTERDIYQNSPHVLSFPSNLSLDSLNEDIHFPGDGGQFADSSSTYTDDSIEGGNSTRPRVIYGFQLEERLCEENLIQQKDTSQTFPNSDLSDPPLKGSLPPTPRHSAEDDVSEMTISSDS